MLLLKESFKTSWEEEVKKKLVMDCYLLFDCRLFKLMFGSV